MAIQHIPGRCCRDITTRTHIAARVPCGLAAQRPCTSHTKSITRPSAESRVTVWRAWRDSNARPFESESNTLSTELQAHRRYKYYYTTLLPVCPYVCVKITPFPEKPVRPAQGERSFPAAHTATPARPAPALPIIPAKPVHPRAPPAPRRWRKAALRRPRGTRRADGPCSGA